MKSIADSATTAAWEAVAEWYHAFFTGVVLTVVTRRSAREAAELVFRIFRRQHLERFLPGLRKLGLEGLPHAVAAAQYHYLSNAIGGVSVEYMYESDRKAWIRYSPPRWIWRGTAICAIPSEVSRAMLLGWHAHNGVSLNNKRLGFVCTKQTVDGQSGLEGYYYEYDHDLAPEERLQFERQSNAPVFDAAKAPTLPTSDWPEARLQKARRNYAIEYVRTTIPEAIQLFGPSEAANLLGLTGRLIGMQFFHETRKAFELSADQDPEAFAKFMVLLARAQGDTSEYDVSDGVVRIRQSTWTLMNGVPNVPSAAFTCWNGLLEGALAAHNHNFELKVSQRLDTGDSVFEWLVTKPRATTPNTQAGDTRT